MIILTCKQCSVRYNRKRTNEIPKDAISMTCNYCENCGHLAKGNYEETFVYKKLKKENKKELLINPNQIDIFEAGA
tara:strand:+ start:465 stop:692 length:228 start_codon:yes stop_codon:yes gene_type:complete